MIYSEFDRLISFSSVHHAIKAEKILAQANIKAVALPTPREIAISCGQCLLFQAKDQDAVLGGFAQGQVRWSKLFQRSAGGYEPLADFGEPILRKEGD